MFVYYVRCWQICNSPLLIIMGEGKHHSAPKKSSICMQIWQPMKFSFLEVKYAEGPWTTIASSLISHAVSLFSSRKSDLNSIGQCRQAFRSSPSRAPPRFSEPPSSHSFAVRNCVHKARTRARKVRPRCADLANHFCRHR